MLNFIKNRNMKVLIRMIASVLFIGHFAALSAQLPDVLEKDILDSYNWILDVAQSSTCQTNITIKEKDIVETNVNQCQFVDEFEMFPNPAKDNLTVAFKAVKRPTQILITGLDGRNFLNEKVVDFDGIYNNQIDLSTIPPGAYVFSIIQDKEVFVRKLIIN